jgi:hypothetical protein
VKKEGVALFLERLKEWHYGEVVRAKGLVNTDAGWFRIDYLPRDIFWEELNAPGGDSRLFIIGVDIRKDTLINDLKALVGP